MEVDGDGRIIGFEEKPANPKTVPGRPDVCLASMGNYIFRKDVLTDALNRDAVEPDSRHDFGRNVIPALLAGGAHLRAYDFGANRVPGDREDVVPYWRDVGTIDSYFIANMEIRSPLPAINLYNRQWRIRTAQRDYPPARFVQHQKLGRVDVLDSLVAEGSIVVSAALHQVVCGYDSFVHAGACVEQSLILSGCDIGAGAKLRRVLLDKNCRIAPGATIGFDAEADLRRFPFRSASGIVALPKGTRVPAEGPIELARDIYDLLISDPATADAMAPFRGQLAVTERLRHSHRSAGPRYERGEVEPID